MNDGTTAIQRARSEHASLRRVIAGISAGAGKPPAEVRALLDELAGLLHTHLQLEDEFVYPALCKADDVVLRRKARRYQFHMGGIAQGFALFYKRWTGGDAGLQAARFWDDWRVFEAALLQRMESEDDDLYRNATKAVSATG